MIWCLPGFLGQPSDYDVFAAAAHARGLPEATAVPLFDEVPQGTLPVWGGALCARVRENDPRAVLVGYFLGGRLALHALLADPGLWRGAVIVSAHLGIEDPVERERRAQADDVWAARFLSEPWDDVLKAWDGQPTFGNRPRVLDRPEAAFDRGALAHALRAWGLGQQEPLAERMGAITCPVLWVAGAQDKRFLAQAERAMQYLPHGALAVAPGAAHRVLWEAPDWFHTSACAFLSTLL